MNPELESWLMELVKRLDYPKIFLNVKKDIVGYTYNRVKSQLRFINKKEAKRLTRKGIIWKPLGKDWNIKIVGEV